MLREPWGALKGNSSKLAILGYSGQFCMLLVTDFGARCDPNVSGTSGCGYVEPSILAILAYFGDFCMILLTDFGSRCDPNVPGAPRSSYGLLGKTRSFGLLWPGLYAISH